MQPIERLLPLLQCPRTASPLTISRDGDLVPVGSPASGRAWPIIDGRPSFKDPASAETPQHSAGAPVIIDYAASTSGFAKRKGRLLNLGAGNTLNKPDNIIEADVVAGTNTDVLIDSTAPLPFRDGTFDCVISLNAIQRYRRPQFVVDEILRVLRPGGEVFVQGTFLAPQHLKPFHYFGATRFGYEEWFSKFAAKEITIPSQYSPVFTLSWVASDIYWWVQNSCPKPISDRIGAITLDQLYQWWIAPETRDREIWQAFLDLPEAAKENTALGFQVRAVKPADPAATGTGDNRGGVAGRDAGGELRPAFATRPLRERSRSKAEIEQAKARVEAATGAWTGHDIHLGQGVYTLEAGWHAPNPRTHQVLQHITDLIGRDFSRLRILDLASGEGCLSVECAIHGAEVVTIEARELNLAKIRLAKEMLNLDRLQVVQDDALNATVDTYGTFDVILCCGLLYHFDAPDLVPFLRRLRTMCRRFLYLDTHVNFDHREAFEFEGRTYQGRSYEELPHGMDQEDREKWVWAGFGNKYSFVPTKPSLLNMLQDSGFSSVMECHAPVYRNISGDRVALIGMAGPSVTPANWPGWEAFPPARVPETDIRPQSAAWFYLTEPHNPHTWIIGQEKKEE